MRLSARAAAAVLSLSVFFAPCRHRPVFRALIINVAVDFGYFERTL